MATEKTGTVVIETEGLTDITISYPANELHPVYHRYETQSQAQGAFVELDTEKGCLSVDWNGEIGTAVPMNVWEGTVKRWAIDPMSPRAMLIELLEKLAPIAGRVCDGDKDAEYEIDELCRDHDEAVATSGDPGVMDAGDWLSDMSDKALGITGDTTDDELCEKAGEIESDAESDGVTLWGTMRELESRRDELK